MTHETLERAKNNRKEREEKISQLNDVNKILANLSDDAIIWLDMNGNYAYRIFPTVKEYRLLLRNIHDRINVEISELDREFEGL